MVRICLNMIVKNESKIIKRLFDSVTNNVTGMVIDNYFICDTGSTDSTIIDIEQYFEAKGIPGNVIYKKFIDFGTNRTYSLNKAQEYLKEEYPDEVCYLLFMDADMVLRVGNTFNKNNLTEPGYSLSQGTSSFSYYNTRLVNTNVQITVKCPTHEYYDFSGDNIKLPSEILSIYDIGDGGAKDNKYSRDIVLLLKGIEEEPINSRYHFYLANTYYDSNDHDSAIIYYKKAITLGSWIEETFYCWYRLGLCYSAKGSGECIDAWLKGWSILPVRVESLYEIIKWYRLKGKNELCNLFYQKAKDIKYPTDCSLFIHDDVYNYKLLEEYTIFGYYVGKRDLYREMFQLMKYKPANEMQSVLSNYNFYKLILEKPLQRIKLNDQFLEFKRNYFDSEYSFIASTPSIIKVKGPDPLTDVAKSNESPGHTYLLNIRFVNYRINPDGTYPYYKNIVTVNYEANMNQDFNIYTCKEFVFYGYPLEDRMYIGVEDIKLFNDIYSEPGNEIIKYTSSSFHQSGKIGITNGIYQTSFNEIIVKNKRECEKNWVFIPGEKFVNKMIYCWDPLTIGELNGNELIINTSTPMPRIFSSARGSTNGFLFGNEIWFLIHYVHHGTTLRNYYHSFVVFDRSMKLLRYSIPFKIIDTEIEYACGLVIEESRIIITHSVWDRESYISVYSMDYINGIPWENT